MNLLEASKASILAQENNRDKWNRLVQLIWSGFIHPADLTTELDALIEDEKFADYCEDEIPADLIDRHTEVSGVGDVPIRNFTLNLETVLKYSPTEKTSDIWHYKELDNCFGKFMTNDPKKLHGCMLEEFGYVRFGNHLISRTVQPIWIHDQGLLNEAVVVLPDMTSEELTTSGTRPVLGGGVHLSGVFELHTPSANLYETLGCKATVVLLTVGLTEKFMEPYPWKPLGKNVQFEDTRVYECEH
jgi:hypothetical protein